MFESLQNSLPQYWTGIYLRFLSICLLYGALVHLGNILNGLIGTEIILITILIILIIAKK